MNLKLCIAKNKEDKIVTTALGLVRSFGEVGDNPVLLEKNATLPVCEGLNAVLASFQALYLQYQKHHFLVEIGRAHV